MEPSRKFFREYRALRAFIAATGLLMFWIVTLDDVKSTGCWYFLGLSALLYLAAIFDYWSSKEQKRRKHRSPPEPEFERRNPPAKLPPPRPENTAGVLFARALLRSAFSIPTGGRRATGDGSRGFQATVQGPASIRRGATTEHATFSRAIQASLRDAPVRRLPWDESHGYHRTIATRCWSTAEDSGTLPRTAFPIPTGLHPSAQGCRRLPWVRVRQTSSTLKGLRPFRRHVWAATLSGLCPVSHRDPG